MAFNHYLNRRNVTIFSVFALAGSYFMLKSRTMQSKRRQQLEGNYNVEPTRSGGGV